jgi:hypothetical protein
MAAKVSEIGGNEGSKAQPGMAWIEFCRCGRCRREQQARTSSLVRVSSTLIGSTVKSKSWGRAGSVNRQREAQRQMRGS